MARYEITGPDGAKYEVTAPDDASEEQILSYAKAQFAKPAEAPKERRGMFGLPPASPQAEAAIEHMRANGFGSGIPKAAYGFGGNVTDMAANAGLSPEVAAAIGFGTNVLTQAIPSFLTSARPAMPSMPGWATFPARKLMQSAVKPSAQAGKDGQKALVTMLDEGIYPTVSGMEKAARISGELDDLVNKAVSGSNAQVSVASIGSRLRDPYNKAMNQVNPKQDLAAIRAAWDEFKTAPQIAGKTEIPVQLAHELKKGTYRALGAKSYGEVGSAATEAQKALARGAREEVAKSVPQVSPLLARQADLMNVREVAGTRALIESNKNPFGLAALRLDDPKSAATFLADRWAALKAFLAMQMYAGVKPEVMVPLGMAATTAQNQPTPALLEQLGILAKP